ncbi:MAG: 2-phospho-L-lactate transferase [Chloroflexota bacterium]|nr:2-phospho-L-lactate transferase [Chloroflexota bacterium]
MALETTKIVALVGGVGGAKLAHGLAQIMPQENLTVIVNTGDDFWHYGLRICPDLDTVMYTLGGVVDPTNGWGVDGDSDAMLRALRRFGEEPWFRLGDQDLATHVLRTQALHSGECLTDITLRLSKALGIRCAILPMTDAETPTIVDTIEHGTLAFQEYFVRHRWQPTVRALDYNDARHAHMTLQVEQAIRQADVLLIAPSNPWLSIEPILHLNGMRDLVLSRSIPRIAISPIIGGKAIKGPAAKLMTELGYKVDARSIAQHYGQIITGFVYDQVDADMEPPSQPHLVCDTIMRSDADRARLARAIINWIESRAS